jgi:hypothetical protein
MELGGVSSVNSATLFDHAGEFYGARYFGQRAACLVRVGIIHGSRLGTRYGRDGMGFGYGVAQQTCQTNFVISSALKCRPCAAAAAV